MEISIFLAKTLGLYLLIVSIGMLISRAKFKPIIMEIINNPSLWFITALFPLIFGILIVNSHNIWAMDWRVVITIIGWLALIKGGLRVLYPSFGVNTAKKWVESDSAYYTSAIIFLLLGLFLGYMGYF